MGARVLLYVEDEDAAFVLFQRALTAENINVQLHRASDGEEALAFLRGTGFGSQRPRPDLVVLDLNLPRRDGLDVLSEIRKDGDLQALRVVIFTSSSLSADKRKSLALGAQDYITKPFTYDGFVEAVKAACSHLPAQ
ncbi:MAG: response regulator [Acidobacteriaceae bacterium]|nr:response regulator [Acidobacteriaceae bacterium]